MSCEKALNQIAPRRAAPEWSGTKQRDDLKDCPFCGTRPVQQVRLATSETGVAYRIGCGNSFCGVEPNTPPCAALQNAEDAWQWRDEPISAASLEWLRIALDGAGKAVPVLFTMLAKAGLKEGAMVADEINANVITANRELARIIRSLSLVDTGAKL